MTNEAIKLTAGEEKCLNISRKLSINNKISLFRHATIYCIK